MTPVPDPAFPALLLDRTPTALLLLDASRSLTYLNASASRLLGLSATEALGRGLDEVWPALASALGLSALGESELCESELGKDDAGTDSAAGTTSPTRTEVTGPLRPSGSQPSGDGADLWYEVEVFAAGPQEHAPLLGLEVREATRRRHERQELHELRQILDNSPNCINTLTLGGDIRSMNEGGLQALEVTEDVSCLGLRWQNFWDEDVRPRAEAALARARAGERTTFEGTARTLTGSARWWDVSVSPLRDETGQTTGLLTIARDLTRQQQARASLLKSERRWRKLVEASPLGVAITTSGGALLHANDAYVSLLGFSHAEFEAGIDWLALTPDEYHAIDEAAYRAVLNGGPPQVYEKELFGRNGQRIPVGVVLMLDGEPDDGLLGEKLPGEEPGRPNLLSYLQDLRPFRAAELALREHGDTLRHQIEERTAELEEQNAALNAFTRFTEVSALVTEPSALIEQAGSVLQTALGPVQVEYADTGLDASAPPFSGGVLFTDGAQRQAATATYPYFSLEGQPSGLLTVTRSSASPWNERQRSVVRSVGLSLGLALDRAEAVAALDRHTQELERSNNALAAANEELEAFAYSASHDLRTPVRHVLAFTDMARKALSGTVNDKALGHLNVVQQAGERMNTLIDAMLLLSRAGRQEFLPRMVDLSPLLIQARRDVGAEFPSRPIRWIGTDPTPPVWGDAAMLQQVLTNLLSNAVKYSARQEVSLIEVRVETRPDEWAISVRDNGVGFNPQYAQKLFGVFQRLHSARDYQGTGVGLATVRRIVLKHSGRVFAESVPGEGAVFGFTLPRPVELRRPQTVSEQRPE